MLNEARRDIGYPCSRHNVAHVTAVVLVVAHAILVAQ